jgi:hypothetical protein
MADEFEAPNNFTSREYQQQQQQQGGTATGASNATTQSSNVGAGRGGGKINEWMSYTRANTRFLAIFCFMNCLICVVM